MNLLPTKFIARHQAKLLFIVVWAHVTILDLCYVTYSGPIFFWQDSLQLFTIITHLTVASLTLAFYFMLIHLITRFRASNTTKQAQASKRASY